MNIHTTQMMYDQIAPVNRLNDVPGFDPRRFLRKTVTETGRELLVLDLRYRKLWFRLKYPAGRIVTTPVTVTEENAVFETKIFFDGTSILPNATNTAARAAKGKYAALYIQNAQNASVGEALNDAGFGLQFCDVGAFGDIESTGGEVKQAAQPHILSTTASAPDAVAAQSVEEKSAVQVETPVKQEIENPPAAVAEPEKEEIPEPAAEPEVEPEPEPEPSATAEFSALRFTPDMPVEDILNGITPEEAETVVVDFGICKGMTLAEVAEKRIASLKFFSTGYTGENNLVRAGAKVIYDKLAA